MAKSADELLAELAELGKSAEPEFKQAESLSTLNDLRTKYLGKKGAVSDVLKSLKDVDGKDRPRVGEAANLLRDKLGQLFDATRAKLEAAEIAARVERERIDVTLPGRKRQPGARHPLIQTRGRLLQAFTKLGFSVVEGPEIDTDFCNFEALNIPADHPARDDQDSLFVREGIVLRTQTSSVQIRTMLSQEPPIKVVAPGAVYRKDDVDATHSPMFHQIEGLYVDKNVTLEELKGTIEFFCKELFGSRTEIRLRSSYFPFTEPSVEADASCVFCSGKGCRVCKQTGWIEILGAGMVNPALYEKVGYQAEHKGPTYPERKYSGFAFGLGIERFAMMLYGIDDIRHFYENDVRFLEQFV